MTSEPTGLTYGRYVDLAAERLGGSIVEFTDEFFAPATNLIRPGRGVFIEDKYTDHGKWMDGWETRRHRAPDYDWCVIKLGLPGRISAVDIDTHHFKGNHPEACSIDVACVSPGETPTADAFTELVPRAELDPDSQHLIRIDHEDPVTHVRLNIYPDGGVARLRIYGTVVAPSTATLDGDAFDLVSVENGGTALAASNQFFSDPINLIMPGRGTSMADGWETRRRRGPGHDWAVLALGQPGVIERVVVDTHHFKGNYPQRCSIDGCVMPSGADLKTGLDDHPWTKILPDTALSAHREHRFDDDVVTSGPITHVRLNIFPDGGVSRLRLFGRPAQE